MSVFYRSPRVLITEDVFEVACTAWCRYAIRDLRDVHIVRQDPGKPIGDRLLGLSALVAGLLVVPVIGGSSAELVVLTLVVLAAAVAVTVRRSPPVTWRLMATHRGRRMVLFTSVDQGEFEQVCRALQRGLDRRDEVG